MQSEHFVNLPRDATDLDDDPCSMAGECVVSAIERDFAVLASPNTTDEQKLAALKSLGHWVATSTSPCALHPRTTGAAITSAHGAARESLHALWDSCIVEERLGTG